MDTAQRHRQPKATEAEPGRTARDRGRPDWEPRAPGEVPVMGQAQSWAGNPPELGLGPQCPQTQLWQNWEQTGQSLNADPGPRQGCRPQVKPVRAIRAIGALLPTVLQP